MQAEAWLELKIGTQKSLFQRATKGTATEFASPLSITLENLAEKHRIGGARVQARTRREMRPIQAGNAGGINPRSGGSSGQAKDSVTYRWLEEQATRREA